MDNESKILIGIGVIIFAIFLGMALTTYQIKLDAKDLQVELSKIEEKSNTNESLSVFNLKKQIENYEDLNHKLLLEMQRIAMLEESVDSKDKRWSRIKVVRKAIQDTSSKVPPILELTSIASAIIDYSDEYDVPTSLILGVAKTESNFQRKAISKAGAMGLMQVMQDTAKEISGDVGNRHYSLYNVRNNIQFGTYYLRKMLDTFDGDDQFAIRAYNAGPTYVEKVKAGEYQRYPSETVKYLETVLTWKKKYENMGL